MKTGGPRPGKFRTWAGDRHRKDRERAGAAGPADKGMGHEGRQTRRYRAIFGTEGADPINSTPKTFNARNHAQERGYRP